jgi:glutaredoxin 3
MKRKIEIFTAGCPICDEQVEKVKALACSSCKVETLNVKTDSDSLKRANDYNIKSLPAVAINGKLADCCSNKGIDMEILKSLGLGGIASE